MDIVNRGVERVVGKEKKWWKEIFNSGKEA